jgi:hypothetical protein
MNEHKTISWSKVIAGIGTGLAAVPHMPPGSAIIGTTSEQAYNPDHGYTLMRKPKPRI